MMAGSAYPLVHLLSFDFIGANGEFHVDSHSPDDILSWQNTPYCLVPEKDLAVAFASLQDAGEAAGCPPGQNTLEFINDRRTMLSSAMAMISMFVGLPDGVTDKALVDSGERLLKEYGWK